MSVDSNAKALLVAIQRRQGHVTLADIKSILPIESMTSEEIGLTIVQLEDAGINIEVDKELLRPRVNFGIVGEQPTFHSPFVPGASARWAGATIKGRLRFNPLLRLGKCYLQAPHCGVLELVKSPLLFLF